MVNEIWKVLPELTGDDDIGLHRTEMAAVSSISKFEGLSIAFFAGRAASYGEALVLDSRRKTASRRQTTRDRREARGG